jgi:hypothetical protein
MFDSKNKLVISIDKNSNILSLTCLTLLIESRTMEKGYSGINVLPSNAHLNFDD